MNYLKFFLIFENLTGLSEAPGALICNTVFGVNSGDTCFSIAQGFGLSSGEFEFINPNIDCAALFVGQWVCVQGSARQDFPLVNVKQSYLELLH